MTEKKDTTKTPFYQNIATNRKHTHIHPPKPARSASAEQSGSPARGEDRPQNRDHVPGGDRTRSAGSPARSDRPAPAFSADRKPGEGFTRENAPRDRSPREPDGRAPRDRSSRASDGRATSARAPRSPRNDHAPRDGRGSRDGFAPRGFRPEAPRGESRPGGENFAAGEGRSRDGARSAPKDASRFEHSRRPFAAPPSFTPVFGDLPKDTKALLDAFPEIVQSVQPLDSKRLLELPSRIRDLSHELTDERSDRRVGYLNDPAELSAYIRYYMWWNLVRLSRLFVSLTFELKDGDSAVDLGSGPLTVPIALWMARPELRKKKITWFCVDISQGALAAGEELFLSLAARTGDEPWDIVRVKGESGVSLRRKVSLVASANMFNELFWDNPQPLEAQAKHHASGLASYADADASILVVEPGVPRAGRFVSLLRDSFLRLGFSVVAPCPHEGLCPFPGLRYGKWCHFVFDTSDAPAKLHKLSDDAGLAKDRAALSFVFARRTAVVVDSNAEGETIPSGGESVDGSIAASATVSLPITASESAPTDTVKRLSGMFHGLRVRITSDPIRLPDYNTGRYGCSELGMVLVCGTYQAADYLQTCESGSLIEVPRPDRKIAEYDKKTDALIVRLK